MSHHSRDDSSKGWYLQCVFQDRQRSEIVNILSSEVVASSASQAFDYVLPGLTNYEPGEVLADSRGNGSLQ